jgi:hypothetical protein
MFFIGFTTGARTDEAGGRYAEGEMTLGAGRERFQSDLAVLSMRDYETQWRDAISRILSRRASSVLITSWRPPGAGFHVAWPMWREGATVRVRQRLFPNDQLPQPFDPAMVYDLVGERRTADEEGERTSEWRVPLEQLATFLTFLLDE